MKILALEPYYGGSHKAFLDGWQSHSQHEFTVLGLPAFKWKWRMRHSPVTFASQLNQVEYQGQTWDAIWCSDMLSLAEFLGLARSDVKALPRIAYFHENQLTYPIRDGKFRDQHFTYSNFTTALAADQVWFNSQYHLDDFLSALQRFMARMPDYQSLDEVDSIRAKSSVQYPGVDLVPASEQKNNSQRQPGPLRICWNARWEHDKNPEDFFAALRVLKQNGHAFRLIVLGESYRNSPSIFETAKQEFANEIQHWGYADTRAGYRRLLAMADVVVSTAIHEFFGIGIVEAVAAGVFPILPNRLAYPEVTSLLGLQGEPRAGEMAISPLYDGAVEQLVERLVLAGKHLDAQQKPSRRLPIRQMEAAELGWPVRAGGMDAAVDALEDAP